MSLLDDYGCGGGLSVDADGGGPGELHRIALRRRVGDGDCAGLFVLGEGEGHCHVLVGGVAEGLEALA